jgi:2-polyprenyl-3-methyl-5-hydroxy-6-metoxy-1,4-benzoquinol methylase
MYDGLSADYDRFVDWKSRLAAELPFIERELRMAGMRRVLDVACGTGMHAVALARRGYKVVGTDLSAGMVERARVNATAAGVDVRFEVAGFGELGTQVGADFDALLCLGNSLPHLLTPVDLAAALSDFAACLQPGGLLLVQNRNFDAVLDLAAFCAQMDELFQPLSAAIREMFYKEENILYPAALEKLSAEEWERIRAQELEVGYCYVEPGDQWPSQLVAVEAAPSSGGAAMATEGLLHLDTGVLTAQEINRLLTHFTH